MISWTSDLSVGVETIDEQHKEIFAQINGLMEACNQGKGKQQIGEVIAFLGDYVGKHFGQEEEYMKKYGYPAYPQHKAQHEQFIKDFINLKDSFAKEGAGLSLVISTNKFLVSWLQNHIRNTDKALGQFLKGRLAAK